MWKKMRERIKKNDRRLILAAVLFCVAALFAAALLAPWYYHRIYDSNTVGKVNDMEVDIAPFDVEDYSFRDKLYVLSRADRITVIELGDIRERVDKDSLLGMIRRQLYDMRNLKMLDMDIDMMSASLEKCECFTLIYTDAERDKNSNSTSCWRVTCKNKSQTITVYLDETYSKIYFLEVRGEMYESAEKTESDFEERAKENYSSWWRECRSTMT